MSANQDLDECLKDRGHSSVRAFITSHPEASYPELAQLLGPSVLPVQVLDMHLREAHTAGRSAYRIAAAESLARQLRALLPQGWSRTTSPDVDPEFVNISAWVTWTSALAQVDRDETVISRLWDALNTHASPGWRPSSGDDPVIVNAFNEAWPG
jgi:hypothetical protein